MGKQKYTLKSPGGEVYRTDSPRVRYDLLARGYVDTEEPAPRRRAQSPAPKPDAKQEPGKGGPA